MEKERFSHGNLAVDGKLIVGKGEKLLKIFKSRMNKRHRGGLYITNKRVVFLGKMSVRGLITATMSAMGKGDVYLNLPYKAIKEVSKKGWLAKSLNIEFESKEKRDDVSFFGIKEE